MILRGARCAFGPRERMRVCVKIIAGRVTDILDDPEFTASAQTEHSAIDLSGFLIMPGLVNAHDHLQFALFPQLADPPYQNYIDWGADIHDKFRDVIAKHRAVPQEGVPVMNRSN